MDETIFPSLWLLRKRRKNTAQHILKINKGLKCSSRINSKHKIVHTKKLHDIIKCRIAFIQKKPVQSRFSPQFEYKKG